MKWSYFIINYWIRKTGFCLLLLENFMHHLSLKLLTGVGKGMKFSLINESSWKAVFELCEARLNGSQVGPFPGVWEVKQFVFALYQFFYSFNLISSPSGSIIKSSVLYIFIKHLFWTLICISDNITKCMHFKYSLHNCD